MSIFDRYEFLVPEHGRRDLGLLRWALVIVFLWFGAMKFTAYEAYGIAPFIEHSPIMNWLGMFGTQGQSYFIGVIELSTGLVLILGAFRPLFSALGALMSAATYLITLTFFITTRCRGADCRRLSCDFGRCTGAVSTEGRSSASGVPRAAACFGPPQRGACALVTVVLS
jgi:uncharacterized membrane protein YkgB